MKRSGGIIVPNVAGNDSQVIVKLVTPMIDSPHDCSWESCAVKC